MTSILHLYLVVIVVIPSPSLESHPAGPFFVMCSLLLSLKFAGGFSLSLLHSVQPSFSPRPYPLASHANLHDSWQCTNTGLFAQCFDNLIACNAQYPWEINPEAHVLSTDYISEEPRLADRHETILEIQIPKQSASTIPEVKHVLSKVAVNPFTVRDLSHLMNFSLMMRFSCRCSLASKSGSYVRFKRLALCPTPKNMPRKVYPQRPLLSFVGRHGHTLHEGNHNLLRSGRC